jgi:hypothetical protein
MSDRDATLWIFAAAALGFAGFGAAGWSPVAGMVVAGIPASLLVATVAVWDAEDE